MTAGHWPVLVGTPPTGRDTSPTGHSSPNRHSLCRRGAEGVSWGCPGGSTGRRSDVSTDDSWRPVGRRLCKPWPRCPVRCISCSGSIACDAHRSSTSCLERSWLENLQRIPSPGENHRENEGIKKMNESCMRVSFLTPPPLGSPSQHWSTYQSPSHSQLRVGSSKLCSGWGFIPVTSLHGQRSVGSRASVKLSTGFHLWGQRFRTTHVSIKHRQSSRAAEAWPGFHRSPLGTGWRSRWA